MLENVRYCGSGWFHSAEPWTHPARVIDSYELIYVTDGTFRMSENGIVFSLQKGDCLMLEPGRGHRGEGTAEGVGFIWAHFYAEAPPLTVKLAHCADNHRLPILFRQLLHYSNLEGYPGEGCNYLIRLAILELRSEEMDRIDGPIRQAAEWIRARNWTPVRVSEVAEAFGYNSDYLSRAFHKAYGCGVKEFIERTRMDYLRYLLLTTNDPLKTVAVKGGFSDYKYFLRFFRAHEAMTPTDYRNAFTRMHMNIR